MRDPVEAWQRRGEYRTLAGHRVFTLTAPALGSERAEPLLVLHGFPTSSFDFHLVLDALRAGRCVHFVDFVGYGLSDKPDIGYTIALQADVVANFTAAVGLTRLALLTHDMGDTVGGELLARQQEGAWPVEVTRRVLTNGSIYIAMAHLTPGQELLLAMPDQRVQAEDLLGADAVKAGLAATFSPRSQVADDEVTAMWRFVAHHAGHRLLPRLIRYIEERRRHEARYTGAIERHPSALHVVWGADDPVAVLPMVERLRAARADATTTVLEEVGHYPMLEAPERFAAAVTDALDA